MIAPLHFQWDNSYMCMYTVLGAETTMSPGVVVCTTVYSPTQHPTTPLPDLYVITDPLHFQWDNSCMCMFTVLGVETIVAPGQVVSPIIYSPTQHSTTLPDLYVMIAPLHFKWYNSCMRMYTVLGVETTMSPGWVVCPTVYTPTQHPTTPCKRPLPDLYVMIAPLHFQWDNSCMCMYTVLVVEVTMSPGWVVCPTVYSSGELGSGPS